MAGPGCAPPHVPLPRPQLFSRLPHLVVLPALTALQHQTAHTPFPSSSGETLLCSFGPSCEAVSRPVLCPAAALSRMSVHLAAVLCHTHSSPLTLSPYCSGQALPSHLLPSTRRFPCSVELLLSLACQSISAGGHGAPGAPDAACGLALPTVPFPQAVLRSLLSLPLKGCCSP